MLANVSQTSHNWEADENNHRSQFTETRFILFIQSQKKNTRAQKIVIHKDRRAKIQVII